MRSLYVKFAFSTIIIMLISSFLAFMFANFYYQQSLKPKNDLKNTEIARSIAQYIEANPTLALESYLENMATVGYQLFLTDEKGNESFFGAPFRDHQLDKSVIRKVLTGEVYHGIANYPQETFVTGFFANELTNTIGVPFMYDDKQFALFMRPNIKLLFNEMHFLFAWLLALTIILSIVLVLISTKYLVQPIAKLTKATEKLAEGNFAIELEINREDEIGQLANSFSTMVKQLKKLDAMKSEFISNVSHDIRSPLSNIKGYLHLLEHEKLSKEERSNYFAIVQQEISRLSNLTKQLLLLASLDTDEDLLEKETYLLSNQLRQLIQHYKWQVQTKEIMLSFKLPDLEINGDKKLLYNVFENLLTNAIKYNRTKGTIKITAAEHQGLIKVCFEDTGIGFSKTAIKRAFERFYREDRARSRDIEGTGLGLSIVNMIVKLHGGDVNIASEKDEGTKITVTLPKM